MLHIKKQSAGFSLVELLVCLFLLSLLAASLLGSLLYANQNINNSGMTARANLIAEEGLEAVRNIRDNNFSNLTNGTFGLAIASNQWSLSGSSDTVDSRFVRTVAISTVSAAVKQVISTVTWTGARGRQESVVLTTYLGNIALNTQQSSSLVVNTSGWSTSVQDLLGITLQNTGSTAITIDRMTVSWTNASLTSVANVRINNSNVFTGTAVSGTNIDITNTSIPAVTTYPLSRIRFNGSFPGGTYTLTFTMTDGSTKTVTFP